MAATKHHDKRCYVGLSSFGKSKRNSFLVPILSWREESKDLEAWRKVLDFVTLHQTNTTVLLEEPEEEFLATRRIRVGSSPQLHARWLLNCQKLELRNDFWWSLLFGTSRPPKLVSFGPNLQFPFFHWLV